MVAGKGTWATGDTATAVGLNAGYDSSGNIKLTADEKIMDANAVTIVDFTQTASAAENIVIGNNIDGSNPFINAGAVDVGIDIEGCTFKNTDATATTFTSGTFPLQWKIITGTTEAAATTTVAHELTEANICGTTISIASSGTEFEQGPNDLAAGTLNISINHGADNTVITHGSSLQSKAYKMLIFYTAYTTP